MDKEQRPGDSQHIIRKRILFYGWVQGVGFRYRAKYAAETYGCTGWAQNEYDGSVVMEIQGTEEAIKKVLDFIGDGKYVRVERTVVQEIPVEQEYGFYGR